MRLTARGILETAMYLLRTLAALAALSIVVAACSDTSSSSSETMDQPATSEPIKVLDPDNTATIQPDPDTVAETPAQPEYLGCEHFEWLVEYQDSRMRCETELTYDFCKFALEEHDGKCTATCGKIFQKKYAGNIDKTPSDSDFCYEAPSPIGTVHCYVE